MKRNGAILFMVQAAMTNRINRQVDLPNEISKLDHVLCCLPSSFEPFFEQSLEKFEHLLFPSLCLQ